MKLQYLIWLSAIAPILPSCGTKETTGNEGAITVDVAAAIENQQELKASMLGSKIRFVPLETSDSSLLTDSWRAVAFGDRIIIANVAAISFGGQGGNSAMMFDLNTGKFLTLVGKEGSGPGEYSSPLPEVNAEGNTIYFVAGNRNGWETYGTDGKYKEKVLPEVSTNSHVLISVKDSIALVERYDLAGSERRKVYERYALSGNLLDSLVMFEGQEGMSRNLTFGSNPEMYTHNTPLRSTLIEFVDDGKSTMFPGGRVWKTGDEFHLKEEYCDTIYKLEPGNGEKAVMIFDAGEHRFPFEKINKEMIGDDNIIITDVLETPSKVIFSVSHGWIGKEGHKEYICLYDHKTGKTVTTEAGNKFSDDLSGFMPFVPNMITSDGKLIGYLTMEEIEEWMEDNPDAERPTWLNGRKTDDNPVLVIVEE